MLALRSVEHQFNVIVSIIMVQAEYCKPNPSQYNKIELENSICFIPLNSSGRISPAQSLEKRNNTSRIKTLNMRWYVNFSNQIRLVP